MRGRPGQGSPWAGVCAPQGPRAGLDVAVFQVHCSECPCNLSFRGTSWLGAVVSQASGLLRSRPRPGGCQHVCLHFLVTPAGRKQLGGVQCWHAVTAGPLRPPSRFQRLEAQVPVIESRGMIFTHYRKPGMLLDDFYLL